MHILTIPGDGIGPEVTRAAVAVLHATGLPLEFSEAEAGWATFQRTGAALPEATLAAAQAADAILFGAVASPSHPVAGYRSPIVALRKALGLYANIRPTQGTGDREQGLAPEPRTLTPDPLVDLVVVRENTEGLYAGRERVEDGGDTAIAERVITRAASERIVRAAFELARCRGQGTENQESQNRRTAELGTGYTGQQTPGNERPKVTIVHKANVLRETCGLFRTVALEVARAYPDIACDELLVDTAALQLVQRPTRFDVIVTTNLFGDILSDVACYWGGGMGMATSANIGAHHALFEPVHGAAPDIAGRGVANPLAAIGCAAMLLEWHAARPTTDDRAPWFLAAQRVRAAAQRVRADGPHTPDLGGTATTDAVTNAVIAAMSMDGATRPNA